MKSLIVPPLTFTDEGKPIMIAAAQSSKHDFDFLEGRWRVRNRKLVSRLSDCNEWVDFEATQEMRQLLQGKGNIDSFITDFGGERLEGVSFRLFNSQTRLWSIYWVDTVRETLDEPVIGFFENGVGHFVSLDRHESLNVICVFRWDIRNPLQPVWSQALSPDNGLTWEWNWFMYFTKDETATND